MTSFFTVKPVLSGYSKRRQKMVFKTDCRLMQFKSIADSAILKHQYSKTCLKRPLEKKDQKCFLRQIVA